MLSHDVYFTLLEPTDSAVQALIKSCQSKLRDHDGVEFFGVGALEPGLDRPVNDQEFHVALHVVFRDRAAHDVYQTAKEHLDFIQENQATWAKVRVFDSAALGGPGRTD